MPDNFWNDWFPMVLVAMAGMAVMLLWMRPAPDYVNCVVVEQEDQFTGDYLQHDSAELYGRISPEECADSDRRIDGGDGKMEGRVRWAQCRRGPDCDEIGMH